MLLDKILDNLYNNSDDIAYRDENETFTYKQLKNMVEKIYMYIKENKLSENILVYGHKQIYILASFIACSMAGITYIPVDSSIPIKRIQKIINLSKPGAIFCVEDLTNIKYEGKIVTKNEIVCLCKEERKDKEEIKIMMKPENIYYIIFTSGSTGEPKGVKVTYENLNSFINWYANLMGYKQGRVLNQANFSFDLSVADIYLSLVTASELVVLNKNIQKDFSKLFKFLGESDVDTAVMTPSFSEFLMIDKSFNKELLKKLSTIYFCGEFLNIETVKKLRKRFEDIRIINSYGPTECTVAVSGVDIDDLMLSNDTLPIGYVKDGTKVYIVDEGLNELIDGKMGEILIAGDSVSDGYINNINDNKFISYKGEKAYLTGDIGYKIDNMLWYKCRKDAREGVNLTTSELFSMAKTIAPLIKQGQSIYSILENHKEITISAKTLYTYIEMGLFNDWGINNLSLKRKVKRKIRTKKQKVNNGEIQQYYVENNHPAIIEPEIFEMVRIEKDRRLMLNGKYSGTDILTSRIKCGECGGSYGAKVWHSSSKYKKVIYQCNRKYAGKEKCKTPAIRADDVETRFVNAVNSIIENKDEIISNLEMVLDKICNKKELSEEKEKLEKSLAEQVEKIQELIDMNSRVAQNQEKYKKEYDAMIKTYDETKFKYEQLEIESSQQAAKHQMIKDYINTLKKQNKPLTKFDGLMWGSLLESATIKDKDTIVFKFKDGTEING